MEEEEIRRARETRDWDDWAVYDEMQRGPSSMSRKRTMVEVTMGPVPGEQGASRSFRLPVPADKPVSIQMVVGIEAESEEDDATTVKAEPAGAPSLSKCRKREKRGKDDEGNVDLDVTVPLSFEEFQAAFEGWIRGSLTNAEIVAKHGPATLDMMQAQRICQLEEESKDQTEGAGGTGNQESLMLGPMESGPRPGVAMTSVGDVADTMLDVVLESASVPEPSLRAGGGGECGDGDADARGDLDEGCTPRGQEPGGGAEPVTAGGHLVPMSGTMMTGPDVVETMSYSQFLNGEI